MISRSNCQMTMKVEKSIVLYRHNYLDPEILGHLIVVETSENGASRIIFKCNTLELSYKNNKRNISAVPAGFYKMVFEYSPKFKRKLWELKSVPGRSEAKIHQANYFRQLNGCVAVGDMFLNIDNDRFLDLRNSLPTLERFHTAMEGVVESTIRIVGKA